MPDVWNAAVWSLPNITAKSQFAGVTSIKDWEGIFFTEGNGLIGCDEQMYQKVGDSTIKWKKWIAFT